MSDWRVVVPLAPLSAADFESCFFTTAEDNPTVSNFIVKTALYLGCFGQCDYRAARDYFLQARSLLPYITAYADVKLIVPLLSFAFFAELYYESNEYLNIAFRCTLSALNLCFTQNATELQPFANSMYCWLMLVSASFSYTPPQLPQHITEKLFGATGGGGRGSLRDKYAWHWLHRLDGTAFLVALNHLFLDASRGILRYIYPNSASSASAKALTPMPSPSFHRPRSPIPIPTITTTTTTTVAAVISDDLSPTDGLLKAGSWNPERGSFDLDLSTWATSVVCEDLGAPSFGYPSEGLWGSGEESNRESVVDSNGRSPDVRSSIMMETAMPITLRVPSPIPTTKSSMTSPRESFEGQEMMDLENLYVLETNLRMAYCQLCCITPSLPASRRSSLSSQMNNGATPSRVASPTGRSSLDGASHNPPSSPPSTPTGTTSGISPTVLGLLQSKLLCTLVLLHWRCGGEEEQRLHAQRSGQSSHPTEEEEYPSKGVATDTCNVANVSPLISGAKTRAMLSAVTFCSELERILLQQQQRATGNGPNDTSSSMNATTPPGSGEPTEPRKIPGGGWLLAHVAQDMHMVAEVLNALGRTDQIDQFVNTLTHGVLHPPGAPDENHHVVNLGRILCRWSRT
jgi:hypothetical protein